MWADSHLTWTWTGRGSSRKCTLCKGFRFCYQLPWKLASVSVMQGLCGWFWRNLPPPPLLLTWPRTSASTRLCKLSYHPSQPETTQLSTIHPTISSTKVSGMWARVAKIIIDNSLPSIYITDGFIITLLCIIIILHLHPASICPCLCCLSVSHCHCPLNVSMSQCVLTIHWLLPIAAW